LDQEREDLQGVKEIEELKKEKSDIEDEGSAMLDERFNKWPPIDPLALEGLIDRPADKPRKQRQNTKLEEHLKSDPPIQGKL
jgi:hypothetical protein